MNRNGAALEAGPVGAPLVHSSSALPKKVTSLLPTVEQGCCCCTLPTCCKVQGWMALVGGVLEVLRLLILLVTPSTEKSTICDDKDNCLNIGETNDTSVTNVIIQLIIVTITIVTAYLFLKGISENKPSLMVHYIRLCAFHITYVLCLAVFFAVVIGGGLGFVVFIIVALFTALPLYCLICANSLHVKMAQELEAQSTSWLEVQAVAPAGTGPASAPAMQYGATEGDSLDWAHRNEFSYD